MGGLFLSIFTPDSQQIILALRPGNALTELASLQRDYEARFNIVEQAACDSENDEVEPLTADRDDYADREHELADQITRYLTRISIFSVN